MSRISSIFSQPGHKAFIAYVTVGYPSIEATLSTVSLLAENGCDMVELGIPFSDPIADGVTIQKASFHALKNGVTPERCLAVARELRQQVSIPLTFMSYFNPILHYGQENFCNDCASSGIDGLIIPDLPPNEGGELESLTQKHNLDLIYLLSPASTEERIRLIAQRSRGFIYLVSVTGVTGARNALPSDLKVFLSRVRKVSKQPLCVGFGISTPEQAGQIATVADGVIIGSRIIQLMDSGEPDTAQQIQDFARGVRKELDQ